MTEGAAHGPGERDGRERRPWYREPETFIAVAALVVSISAVVVGLYEAALQRRHDRAEVWPHLEVEVFTKPTGAVVYLDNTGIGPAIVQQMVVRLDGRRAGGWQDVVTGLLGHPAPQFANFTVLGHGLRAGDRVALIDLPNEATPRPFWDRIRRVGISLCYADVFDDHWTLTAPALGTGPLRWRVVDACPPQPDGTEF